MQQSMQQLTEKEPAWEGPEGKRKQRLERKAQVGEQYEAVGQVGVRIKVAV